MRHFDLGREQGATTLQRVTWWRDIACRLGLVRCAACARWPDRVRNLRGA